MNDQALPEVLWNRGKCVFVLGEQSTHNHGNKETNEPPHDKTNKMTVRPAKTQIILGIRPV